jgi:hypothetical protein
VSSRLLRGSSIMTVFVGAFGSRSSEAKKNAKASVFRSPALNDVLKDGIPAAPPIGI